MPNVLPSQTTKPAVAPAPPTIPQKVSANTVQPPTTTAQSRSPDDIPVITPKPVVAAPSRALDAHRNLVKRSIARIAV